MPDQWLEEQPCEVVRWWVHHSEIPKMATLLDGTILYANQAFEELVGYGNSELIGKISWVELTWDPHEASDDLEMATQLLKSGGRVKYSFHKRYCTKSGVPIPVVIHVQRYPMVGDLQFFLVSTLPVTPPAQVALDQVAKLGIAVGDMRQSLVTAHQDTVRILEGISETSAKVAEYLGRPPWWKPVLEWSAANPVKASGIALFLTTLLFGERVLETAESVMNLLRGM